MKNDRTFHNALMISSVIGAFFGLFYFWPFALIFLVLGTIATFMISALTGHMVNFFLVLLVEFLLILTVMFVALKVHERRLREDYNNKY